MIAAKEPTPRSLGVRVFTSTTLWTWGAILLSVLVCGLISWIHYRQQQVLGQTLAALDDLRQARIDLSKGFLYASQARQPGSPFDREQGLALLQQAVAEFEDALQWKGFQPSGPAAQEPANAQLRADFEASAAVFRELLTRWGVTTQPQPERETDLRIAFFEVERLAEQLDDQIQSSVHGLASRLDSVFLLTLVGAAFLLTGVCGTVFFTGRARRQAVAALRHSEARFRALVEHSAAVIGLADADYRLFYVSPSLPTVLGHPITEALGHDWRALVHPDDLPIVMAAVQRVRAEPAAPVVYVVRVRHRDGRWRWVELTERNLLANPDVGAVAVILRDITEQRQAEEELRREKIFTGAVLDSLPGLFYLYNEQGYLVRWNKRQEELTGYSAAELSNRHVLDWFRGEPEDIRAISAALERVFRDGYADAEANLRAKDGTAIPCYFTAVRLVIDNQTYFTGVGIDISERRRAAQELQQRLREAAALNTLSRDVGASLSLDQVAQAALAGIRNSVDADLALLFLLQGSDLTLHGLHAREPRFRHDSTPVHRVGECLCGLAVSENRSLYSRNIHADARCTWEECKRAGVMSFAALPLRSGDRLLGVLGLASCTEERNFEAQATFLETLGNGIAIGLQNALLYEDARRHQADLARANEELRTEVAERRRAEEAQRAAIRDWQTTFDAVGDAIWLLDNHQRVVRCNRITETLFGRPLSAVLGHTCYEVVHGSPQPVPECPILRMHRSRRRESAELALGARWLEVVVDPILDEQGALCGAVHIVSDITTRKRAEAEVRQLNQELEQRVHERTAQLEAANRELEAFAYSVSHDLRAPLRHIDGYARILVEDHASTLVPEARRLLETVQAGARRMGDLIDGLLTLARLGRQPIARTTVDVAALVRDVWQELTAHLDAARLDLHVAPLPTVQADPQLLRHVWTNLLENALKYTAPRQRAAISIDSHESDGATWYRVQDNGVGFDARYAHKLFGVFQRLHREEDFPGTGVGLATVQRIVHKHGGHVRATGEPDHGATFEFSLGR